MASRKQMKGYILWCSMFFLFLKTSCMRHNRPHSMMWNNMKEMKIKSKTKMCRRVAFPCAINTLLGAVFKDTMLLPEWPEASFRTVVRTKQGLKDTYVTSYEKVRMYKDKLDRRMCAPVWKLWPMHTNILKTGEICNTDGEVVNWSQIV